jgi:hypothetical protein
MLRVPLSSSKEELEQISSLHIRYQDIGLHLLEEIQSPPVLAHLPASPYD